MKTIFLLSLIFGIFTSCSSNTKKERESESASVRSTEKNGSASSSKKSAKPKKDTSGEWEWKDCVRSEPEAVCKKGKFKNHSFRVDSTTSSVHIGYEKATLKNGDLLEITNAGCEYYVLEFQFTTTRFNGDTTDLVYWCDVAIQLMKSIEKDVDAPVMIEESYAILEKFYLESESPELGVQHPINDSEIGTYVSLERIEKISKSKYAITVRYAVGPL